MTRGVKIALGFLAGAVLAACAYLVLRPASSGGVAVVKQDGVVLREIDLDKLEEPMIFTVEGDNGICNTVVAEHGRIRVKDASCPDHICVQQGWISDSGVPIVCLPNKLVIEIVGKGAQMDVVTN